MAVQTVASLTTKVTIFQDISTTNVQNKQPSSVLTVHTEANERII